MLREVHEVSGLNMGELVSEAVAEWYDRLSEIDGDDYRGASGPSDLNELLNRLRRFELPQREPAMAPVPVTNVECHTLI